MTKPAAIFVAVAMTVTAACVGVIVSYGLGLSLGSSCLAALGALGVMSIIHLAFVRAPEPDFARLDDLDRVVTDLQSRLETIEARISTLDGATAERARAAAKPLVEEIAALSGLVTSIAKEVAAHDVKLTKLAGAAPPLVPDVMPPVVEPPSAPPVEAAPSKPRARIREAPPVVINAPPLEPFDPDQPEPLPAADRGVAARLELALRDDRIEIHLQPIVALPSRRTVHYEALSRMLEPGGVAEAEAFLATAVAIGKIAEIDRRAIEGAASVAMRLAASGRGGAVFVNIAEETLGDRVAIAAIRTMLERQSDLARLLVLDLPQASFRALGGPARDALAEFVRRGVRLSVDRAEDLGQQPEALARQGVRFFKVAAERLLAPEAPKGLAIHPADLAGLYGRHGVELIATHVEDERTVPELLDMEVTAAQGLLFGAARPVRPASKAEPAADPAPQTPQRLVPRSAIGR